MTLPMIYPRKANLKKGGTANQKNNTNFILNNKSDQIPNKINPNGKNIKNWAKGPRTNNRQTKTITKNHKENTRIRVKSMTAEGSIQSQPTAAEGGKHQIKNVEI